MRKPTDTEKDSDSLPFLNILPNLVTMIGLCSGLTAIRFVMSGQYQLAVGLIIFSTLIDGLDGLLARRLNATSEIGAQLDSLSDFLNFGVAPGLVVYHFALTGAEETGSWIFVLLYVSCCCLRLARFNVGNSPTTPDAAKNPKHFVGVPAPAGAMLALVPMFLSFEYALDAASMPFLAGPYLAFVGLLMASRLPTFSPKTLRVPRSGIVWIMIGAAFVVGTLITRFWLTMILIAAIYGLSLVYSLVQVLRNRRAARRN
ncbi:MAG: phosphatidylcholine/phosphatidylserine synthase [Rhodobacteraceae bacterium]|nr:phosphatidylcholine/phosphatidylserine synthase [Paracoccaceae bacterium]